MKFFLAGLIALLLSCSSDTEPAQTTQTLPSTNNQSTNNQTTQTNNHTKTSSNNCTTTGTTTTQTNQTTNQTTTQTTNNGTTNNGSNNSTNLTTSGTTTPALSRAEIEVLLDAELEQLGPTDYTFFLKSDDGSTYQKLKGNHVQDRRYSASSASKIFMIAVALHQVKKGRITLDSKLVDVINGFHNDANSAQMTFRNTLAFSSGYKRTSCRFDPDWANCVKAIPTNEIGEVPGGSDSFIYSTGNLDLAGLAAVEASGMDWPALWNEWVAEDAPFLSRVRLGSGQISSGVIKITVSEYMQFLEALDGKTILTPALCDMFFQDQIPYMVTPLTSGFRDWTGEDHHWGFGFWLEQRQPTWNPATPVTRFASIGVGGQYNFIDREHDIKLVISYSGTDQAGFDTFREVEDLVLLWADAI